MHRHDTLDSPVYETSIVNSGMDISHSQYKEQTQNQAYPGLQWSTNSYATHLVSNSGFSGVQIWLMLSFLGLPCLTGIELRIQHMSRYLKVSLSPTYNPKKSSALE
jgi:hypothetical protein